MRSHARALLAAIAERGLTVFARFDHAAGAREVGMELAGTYDVGEHAPTLEAMAVLLAALVQEAAS